MIGVAIKFAKENPNTSVKQIRYTNFDRETVDIFEEEFTNVFLGGEKSDKEEEEKDNSDDEEGDWK